jgi:hypothetical protein
MDLPPDSPAERDDSNIPIPVVLIAVYEFGRAAYIFYAFHAVHNAGANDLFVLMLPVFSVLMLVAGLGLLALQPWARHMFLAAGLLGLPWLPQIPLRMPLLSMSVLDYQILQPYLPRTLMLSMLVIDALAYVTLIYYPDVSAAFGERDGDPYFTGE